MKEKKEKKKKGSMNQILETLEEKKEEQQENKKDKKVTKKNSGKRFLRILLWIILVFFFLRGIVTTLKPDQTAEIEKTIESFKNQYNQYQADNEGILGFAQNFVKEYLTYNNQYEKEYKERIKPYVTDAIYSMNDICNFEGNAQVTYVEAYKKEAYAPNQYDVYVSADIQYEMLTLSEDGEAYDTLVDNGRVTVKVPIYVKKGKYVVEGLPVFTKDEIQLTEHEVVSYSGEQISDTKKNSAIKEALTNFLKAYYQEEQSVIDYYLHKTSKKEKFLGMGGRFELSDITSITSYQNKNNKILSILSINVKDSINGAIMSQKMNIKLSQDGERYYILDINARTENIKMEE